jgi:hypothetical protein
VPPTPATSPASTPLTPARTRRQQSVLGAAGPGPSSALLLRIAAAGQLQPALGLLGPEQYPALARAVLLQAQCTHPGPAAGRPASPSWGGGSIFRSAELAGAASGAGGFANASPFAAADGGEGPGPGAEDGLDAEDRVAASQLLLQVGWLA